MSKTSKKTVSLVLGSGGARGYTHIGVIKELERQGYEIKSISTNNFRVYRLSNSSKSK